MHLSSEIKALTDDRDPSLLFQFIISLFTSRSSSSSSTTTFDLISRARQELSPFFHAHTDTFLRELLEVATSRLPLPVYDRVKKQQVFG
jgi:hypothetical protein